MASRPSTLRMASHVCMHVHVCMQPMAMHMMDDLLVEGGLEAVYPQDGVTGREACQLARATALDLGDRWEIGGRWVGDRWEVGGR